MGKISLYTRLSIDKSLFKDFKMSSYIRGLYEIAKKKSEREVYLMLDKELYSLRADVDLDKIEYIRNILEMPPAEETLDAFLIDCIKSQNSIVEIIEKVKNKFYNVKIEDYYKKIHQFKRETK